MRGERCHAITGMLGGRCMHPIEDHAVAGQPNSKLCASHKISGAHVPVRWYGTKRGSAIVGIEGTGVKRRTTVTYIIG